MLLVALSIAQNDVKGQEALKGVAGEFGTTYTLSNSFNFNLISASYSLEPANAYEIAQCDPATKLLVLTVALKNASSQDNFASPGDWFTLVDDKQQQYTGGSVWLESKGRAENSFTLRPSQGIGQLDLKDSLRIAFKVPGNAKIDKIMVNMGRLNHPDEQAIRYSLVAPPDNDGAKVKNYISPLPSESRDPNGPWGAILLNEGKGKVGVAFPSGLFSIRLDSLEAAADGTLFNGNPPDDGKKYWIGIFTVKSLVDTDLSMFDVYGGDFPTYQLTDADGEQYKAIGFRKKSSDEESTRTFKKGDEYSFRVFFVLPKDVKPKHLSYGTGNSTKWGVDLALN